MQRKFYDKLVWQKKDFNGKTALLIDGADALEKLHRERVC